MAANPETATYDIFLSYAHADLERVRSFDRELRGLLRAPLRRSGLRVFRDETGLAAGEDLTTRLRGALRESAWLVVHLTDAARGSKWVDREVEYWCQELGRSDRLILLRGDDSVDLEWDDDAGRFQRPEQLPPSLVSAVTTPPLYVDLAVGADVDQRAGAVRVVAAVRGRSPEDIAGEEHALGRRRRRLVTATIASLAVLTVASLTAGVLAVQSRGRAERNERAALAEARRATASALASRALVEDDRRPDQALALAVAAHQLDPSATEGALLELLDSRTDQTRYQRVGSSPTAIALSPAGSRLLVGTEAGELWLSALEGPPVLLDGSFDGSIIGVAMADEDRAVIASSDGQVALAALEGQQLEVLDAVDVAVAESFAFDPVGSLVAVGGAEDPGAYLSLLRIDGERIERATETRAFLADQLLFASVSALAFSPDGSRLLVGHFRSAEVLEVPTLQPDPISQAVADASILEVDSVGFGDDVLVVGGNPPETSRREGVAFVLDASTGELIHQLDLAQNVDVVTWCDQMVVLGTRGGSTVTSSPPFSNTEVLRRVASPVSAVACDLEGDAGPIVVASSDGLLDIRLDRPTRSPVSFSLHEGGVTALPGDALAGASIDRAGGEVVLADGRVLPADPSDRVDPSALGRWAELVRGADLAGGSCASLGEVELQQYGAALVEEAARELAACGDLRLVAEDAQGRELSLRRGSEVVARFAADLRIGTYSVAWSGDGDRLFLGGALEGIVYDLSDPSAPQELLTLRTLDFFSAASFVGRDLLVTAETSPQGDFVSVWGHVVGGEALQEIACDLGAGGLEGTVADRLLSAVDVAAIGCAG